MSFERVRRRASISALWSCVALPQLNSEEQQGFAAYFAEQTILSLLIAMPVTALLHVFMIALGVSLFPEQKLTISTYHLLTAAGSVSLFLLARNSRTAIYLPEGGVYAWLIIASLIAITIVLLEDGVFLYIAAVIFTILYICGIVRATFRRAFACCLAALLLVNLAMIAAEKREYLDYMYVNSFMIYASVIGLSMSYTIERLERSKYLLQMRLAEAKKRSDEHSAWLRQLAMFLRHEVRQPIAQITSSIELSALTLADNASRDERLHNAINAAQHVWNLIERASRATDAEAYVRAARPERVEIGGCLHELVQSFTQTYSGVAFSFQPSPPLHTRVDPVLLKEAVSNLVSNAASFAEEGTTVKVSLRKCGGQAEIKVYNQGPCLEGDSEALFQPFATSRSGSASEHQGLGLYLVRLIAQQHGGTAAIKNAADGKGVEASLLLPTASSV